MSNYRIKNLAGATIPTTAVLVCAYLGQANFSEQPNYHLIEKEYAMSPTTVEKSWMLSRNPYYEIMDQSRTSYQIEVIHRFVSKILEESQDLDPRFAKVVDKYFWELA